VTTTDEDIERRLVGVEGSLRALADVEAIKSMHRTYLRCLADGDFARMASFFTDDAVMDLRAHGVDRGREEITAHFDRMAEGVRDGAGYLLTSPVIRIDGDRAEGEWTWHRHFADFPVQGGVMRAWGPWLEGRYRCEYAKVGDSWLFSSIWFRVVLPDPDPGADAPPAAGTRP
jgi:uncharacterized protein (TIGR02246 family)